MMPLKRPSASPLPSICHPQPGAPSFKDDLGRLRVPDKGSGSRPCRAWDPPRVLTPLRSLTATASYPDLVRGDVASRRQPHSHPAPNQIRYALALRGRAGDAEHRVPLRRVCTELVRGIEGLGAQVGPRHACALGPSLQRVRPLRLLRSGVPEREGVLRPWLIEQRLELLRHDGSSAERSSDGLTPRAHFIASSMSASVAGVWPRILMPGLAKRSWSSAAWACAFAVVCAPTSAGVTLLPSGLAPIAPAVPAPTSVPPSALAAMSAGPPPWPVSRAAAVIAPVVPPEAA
jgi:hypothetical protein